MAELTLQALQEVLALIQAGAASEGDLAEVFTAATEEGIPVVLPINPPAVTHKVATPQSGRGQNSI